MSERSFLLGCLTVLGVCGALVAGLVGLLISLCGGGLRGPADDVVSNTLLGVLLSALGIALVFVLAWVFRGTRDKSDKPPGR